MLYCVLGHVIVALSAGATITKFSIVSAHVSYIGGFFSVNKSLWLNVNGALFPLLVSYIYALTYKKSYENVFYRAFSFAVTVCPVASLLAWVIVPVLYCYKKAPVNDDVTKFLFYFSVDHSVIFVSIVAIILMALGVALIIKKQIFTGFFEVKKLIRLS